LAGAASSASWGAIWAALAAAFSAMAACQGASAGKTHSRFSSDLLSCATIALPSPTSATWVGAFWPIASGVMSSWTIFTFLLKRGGRPKCMIQLSRAPISTTTSAFCSAWLRAAPTDRGWVSGITPLPIGEARKGTLVRSMKARTSSSARE
jgi:hypothetical protein